jgi:hypothetical protein
MCLLLTGCALGTSGPPTPEAGAAITGRVMGAQAPLIDAHLYLFAANAGVFTPNATGYGNASVSLLTSGTMDTSGGATNGDYYVTTSVATGTGSCPLGGCFSITSDYTCTAGEQVYLYSLGGSQGGVANPVGGLLAALGTCPGTAGTTNDSFSSGLYVVINEVSTIAAAYSFAGFATDALHVSSSGTPLAQTGIANAFANAANLVGISTGAALATTPAGNGTVPASEIYTLADILAACVNSDPTTSTNCNTLFTNALSGGTIGSQPTDTATAAINMAHNPGANVAALFGLAQATGAPWAGLSTQPNDFTVALNFTGGGLSGSVGIAIDAAGDVWAANEESSAGVNDGNGSVTELSSLGVPSSGSPYTGGSLDVPQAIAIDGSGDAWITNEFSSAGVNGGNGSVTELSSSGAPTSGSPYAGGGLSTPAGIAIDGSGNAWVSDNGGTALSKFNSGGTAQSGAGYTGGGLGAPYGIAIDGSGDAWAVNSNSRSISKLSNAGTPISSSGGYTGGGLNGAFAVALDGSGNAWVTDYVGNSITEFASSGTPTSGSPYTGGGLNEPIGIAIDGSGNVWATNRGDNSISEFSSSGSAISPSTKGYGVGGGPNSPYGVAIDGSGDVWVANVDVSGGGSVTEFIGVGTPVITPICAGLPSTPTGNGTSTLGTRP